MNNFGGNTGLYGDMELIVNRTSHAFATSSSMAGVGITMEGIDQNPAYYQLYDSGAAPCSAAMCHITSVAVGYSTRCGTSPSTCPPGSPTGGSAAVGQPPLPWLELTLAC